MSSIRRYLSSAEKNFSVKNYEKALFFYSLALQEDAANVDAKVGVRLCDLAYEMEGEAQALYDYYMIAKDEKDSNAGENLKIIVDSIDNVMSATSEMLTRPMLEAINYDSSIMYDDFKKIVIGRGGFRRAFEDIMFSTKVVITDTKDFIDFIEDLVTYGFCDMALNYLESASAVFPSSEKIRELFDKISLKEAVETKTTEK